jgi:hypothetical protein
VHITCPITLPHSLFGHRLKVRQPVKSLEDLRRVRIQMYEGKCQIHSLNTIAEPIGKVEALLQRRRRLRRVVKRRWHYLKNLISEIIGTKPEKAKEAPNSSGSSLQAGDRVRVRSRSEIQATLDRWNNLKGCGFMEEMWPYCDTEQVVLKRLKKFLDERDYLVKTVNGVVILEGLVCQGTKDYGICDRSCYYFWREEWLEKLNEVSHHGP